MRLGFRVFLFSVNKNACALLSPALHLHSWLLSSNSPRWRESSALGRSNEAKLAVILHSSRPHEVRFSCATFVGVCLLQPKIVSHVVHLHRVRDGTNFLIFCWRGIEETWSEFRRSAYIFWGQHAVRAAEQFFKFSLYHPPFFIFSINILLPPPIDGRQSAAGRRKAWPFYA